MNTTTIDHVNLTIPEGGVESAIEFYEGTLGLETDDLGVFERGEKPFFSIRLSDVSVIHLWPDEAFSPPSRDNFDHVAVATTDSIETVKGELREGDIEILREGTPLGATGTAPAVYVADPFGYRIEIKHTE